jgi:hypothetical protein
MNNENISNSPITGGKTKKVGEISTTLIKRNIKAHYCMVSAKISEMFNGLSSISILECEDTGYKFYYPFLDAIEAFFVTNIKLYIQVPVKQEDIM